jgi:hypothetical protein
MRTDIDIEKKKSPKKISIGAVILFLYSLPLLTDSMGQLPNVREAIEEKKTSMISEGSVQAGEMGMTEESLEKAKMYSQLLTFKYTPSERDPFISSTVISPFVTEEEKNEITADAEQVNQAKKMIQGVVKNRVKITGIAVGRTGANYAVIYSDPEPATAAPQVLRAGEYILIELGPEEAAMVDNAYQVAAQAGVQLNIKVADGYEKPALMLQILRIDGRVAEIENPTGDGSFPVEFKKGMIRATGPQPKKVSQ